MATSPSQRSVAPDYLKAVLLLAVIFGHTYQDGVSEDAVKYALYGFHMPLFLFLSGYLLNRERLARQQLPELGRRYWSRMLWQWAVVCVAFEVFSGGFRGDSVGESLWLAVVDPRFHLWYIPALMLAIVALWVIAPFPRLLWPLGALFLVAYALYGTPLRNAWDLPGGFDPRYVSYAIFVWAGVVAAASGRRLGRAELAGAAAMAGLGMTVYLMGFDGSGWYRAIGFLVLNAGLALMAPSLMRTIDRPLKGLAPVATLMGTYSLWIYLLHPFVTQTFTIPSGPRASEIAGGLALTAAIAIVAVFAAWVWDIVGVRSRMRGEAVQPRR